MKTQNKIVELIVALAVVTLIAPFGADAQVTQRPIEDFLAAQGTFCFPDGQGGCLLFTDPPVPNFLAFRQSEPERCAVVDYAGLANRWLEQRSGGAISLATTVDGTVTERPVEFQFEFGLFVGREIHVRLHARNALTWVVEGCTLASDALLFGQHAPEVLAGADAALGEALLEFMYLDGEFGSEPGGPLADLVQLLAFPLGEQAIIALRFRASANGELHEAFGVPEGTLGQAVISAVSLVVPQGRGAPSPSATPSPALDEGVPVTRIDLHATRR